METLIVSVAESSRGERLNHNCITNNKNTVKTTQMFKS